jgi:hypothetical protein
MTAWSWICRSPSRARRAEPRLLGRQQAGPPPARQGWRYRATASRLAALTACRRPRQMARKRSRFEVSEVAPFITDLPGGRRALPDRERPFVWEPSGVMLAGCPDSASASALCPMIFTSFLARGRASDGPSSMMSRLGPSPTTGPTACRSPTPNSTCSRHDSAISSINCSGRADDLRRHLP